MRLAWVLTLLLFLFQVPAKSETISVSILSEIVQDGFTIEIKRGSYSIKHSNKEINLSKGAVLNIQKGGKISLGDSVKFYAKSLVLKGKDYVNHFQINSDNHSYKFDDDLKVVFNGGLPSLINIVDLDHYVAGVVEGEAGYGLPLEYYKLQAILCRTYALKNLSRHDAEGFNLCDKVHCQVYHQKCKKNDIIKATASTSGLVVVDHNLSLINTTFHSNCGGQTSNSEDVWVMPVSYLKSVKDSYCLNSPHALWRKEVGVEEFKTVFSENNPIDSIEFVSVLKLCQDTARFPNKVLISTPLTKVRSGLNLNSTFFSVEQDSTGLTLYGKGFGHGVGLCQEGGIEMAKQGFSYIDILKYYYTKVFIVNQRALLFFKED